MTEKTKVIIAGVIAAVIGLTIVGSLPNKTKEETHETKQEQVEKETQVKTHKETKTVDRINPDGSRETTTVVVESSDSLSIDATSTTQSSDSKSETSRDGSKVTISALVGAEISYPLGAPVYGVHVSRPLLGPITVGLWGMSNRTAGVSIGLQF